VAVKDLYDKACEAANKGNYEYAIELYREVLRLEPQYPGARVLLRGTERRRLSERNSPLYTVARLARGIWPLLKALVQLRNPRKRLESCEDFLEHNPNNCAVLLMAGRAAQKAGYAEGAAMILKDLLTVKPDHKRALRTLVDALEESGQTRECLKFLTRLAALMPTNRDVQHRLKDLEAQAHMQETHMAEAGSFREMIRDKEVAQESERRFETAQERAARLLEQARAELEQDPTNVTKIVRVAELYEQQGSSDTALRVLTDAHKQMPGDFEVRAKLGDLQLRICDQILRRLEEKLQKDPANRELIEKRRRLAARRRQVALREYDWRVRQHPTDSQLRLELGKVQLERGDTDAAIHSFQQAARDSRLELDAATMLGRCFVAKQQYDLAAEQFRRAIARHPTLDRVGMELQYLFAETLEKMGESEEALKIYKKIYTNDISFRDVAEKVASLTS